jgi:threonine 3-dehydrogenase
MSVNSMRSQTTLTQVSRPVMRCLVKENLDVDGLTFRDDYPVPKVGRLDVKIKVLSAGICGSDRSIFHSSANEGIRHEMLRYCKNGVFKPVVIGHEFCGIVAEMGEALIEEQESKTKDDFRIEVGDYVTAEAHLSCGYCAACLEGSEHLCINLREMGFHHNGTFAEYLTVPYRNVIVLGKGGINPAIPPRIGAVLDAFGNAVHTAEEAQVAGKTVAILGAGPIGLMSVALASKLGAAKIFLSDAAQVERKFELATALGADLCFDVSKGSATMHEKILKNISASANGVDIVMEMSGAASAYQDAFRLVRNGGQVLLLGLPAKPIAQFDVANGIIYKGVTVKGIFGRKMFGTWRAMLALLEQERYGLKDALNRIISEKTFSIENFQTAFQKLSTGEATKIVFELSAAP